MNNNIIKSVLMLKQKLISDFELFLVTFNELLSITEFLSEESFKLLE
jgi:hypothetical protein